MRVRIELRAMRVGMAMMMGGLRRRPGTRQYRVGSWLYHWGAGRPDLHRSDYRRSQ